MSHGDKNRVMATGDVMKATLVEHILLAVARAAVAMTTA